MTTVRTSNPTTPSPSSCGRPPDTSCLPPAGTRRSAAARPAAASCASPSEPARPARPLPSSPYRCCAPPTRTPPPRRSPWLRPPRAAPQPYRPRPSRFPRVSLLAPAPAPRRVRRPFPPVHRPPPPHPPPSPRHPLRDAALGPHPTLAHGGAVDGPGALRRCRGLSRSKVTRVHRTEPVHQSPRQCDRRKGVPTRAERNIAADTALGLLATCSMPTLRIRHRHPPRPPTGPSPHPHLDRATFQTWQPRDPTGSGGYLGMNGLSRVATAIAAPLATTAVPPHAWMSCWTASSSDGEYPTQGREETSTAFTRQSEHVPDLFATNRCR